MKDSFVMDAEYQPLFQSTETWNEWLIIHVHVAQKLIIIVSKLLKVY